jgi:hypothetical protein
VGDCAESPGSRGWRTGLVRVWLAGLEVDADQIRPGARSRRGRCGSVRRPVGASTDADIQIQRTRITAPRSGQSIGGAARDLAQQLPAEAVQAIEETARSRLQLIAGQPALQAAAREKAESFIAAVLAASGATEQRPQLERELETRCVAAAFDAGSGAWLRGEGSLRECTLRALDLLRVRDGA